MRFPLRWLMVFFMLGLATVRPLSALEAITEGPPARAEFVQAVQRIFEQNDFELLEKMADKMRREKSRFPEGVWKLGSFYGALGREEAGRGKTEWPVYLARFTAWESAMPGSITARIGHARALTAYAWDARGGGYADTISAEGGRLFEERLREARALLDSDPVLKTCPGYFYAMMPIAMGQGWSHAEAERLFNDGVKLAPDFEALYFARATFLQPKWYGRSSDEWHDFALAAAQVTKRDFGMTMYTRVVWSVMGPRGAAPSLFKAARIDWPRMKRGFEDMARSYPDSLWNKNAFCFYAYIAGDRETARRLFGELDGRYAPGIWDSAARFQSIQRWALSHETTP